MQVGERCRLLQEGHEDVVGTYTGEYSDHSRYNRWHHVRDERTGLVVQAPTTKSTVVAEPPVVEGGELDLRSEGDLPAPPPVGRVVEDVEFTLLDMSESMCPPTRGSLDEIVIELGRVLHSARPGSLFTRAEVEEDAERVVDLAHRHGSAQVGDWRVHRA